MRAATESRRIHQRSVLRAIERIKLRQLISLHEFAIRLQHDRGHAQCQHDHWRKRNERELVRTFRRHIYRQLNPIKYERCIQPNGVDLGSKRHDVYAIGGTVSGTIQNQGLFTYNSALFTGQLLNRGTVANAPRTDAWKRS